MVTISSSFDSGNIELVSADAPDAIRLRIRRDNQSDFFQWFHFRLSGARGEACVLRIENAGEAAYPKGWENYQAVASTDRQNWVRVATDYEGGVLTIRHTPASDSVWFAYFAPYAMERHHDLIAECLDSPEVRHEIVGHSVDGQDIDLLRIGTPGREKKVVWMIGRQHPGETMASWWMEGALERLVDPDDPVAGALLDQAVFYVVPNMNPDGSARGHLRTNAVGANLNREWAEPTAERSPEVLAVRNRMDQTGVDICLDIHGDETIPHNFIAGTDGVPSWTPARQAQLDFYRDTLARLCPDFQTEHGYPPNPPGKANLTMCSNQVAERFGALAMTLEMPFKDADDRPDPIHGWSPARCRHLARGCLDALLATLQRDEG